jgi:hypothetical protein
MAPVFRSPLLNAGLGRQSRKESGICPWVRWASRVHVYMRWGNEARIPGRNRMYCNPGSADGR